MRKQEYGHSPAPNEGAVKLQVALAADHAGFVIKNELMARLKAEFEVTDLGAHRLVPDDDYPDYAEAVATAVASHQVERGILICGSGVGACIAANKVPSVRACLCHDSYSAHQGVEHDDMNVLCLGARVVGPELAAELAITFLKARFSNTERFRRRLDKVLAIEKRYSK